MAIGDDIRQQDKQKFADAAKDIGVWILVRGTNRKSLDYIGRAGYTPKPIDCKAKTAKRGPWAGLVVNPYVAEQAFDDLPKQKRFWDEHGNPVKYSARKTHYSVESTGPLQGCVKLDGKYIYGDYDLKAVVVPGHESATIALVTELHGVTNVRRGPKLYEVQRHVNNAIGVEMVQHGAEDEFMGHSEDTIFAFGPKGEYEELHGLAQIQKWYEKLGRKTLDKDFTGGVPQGVKPGIRGVVQADGSIRPVNFRKS